MAVAVGLAWPDARVESPRDGPASTWAQTPAVREGLTRSQSMVGAPTIQPRSGAQEPAARRLTLGGAGQLRRAAVSRRLTRLRSIPGRA